MMRNKALVVIDIQNEINPKETSRAQARF